jgi:hypothetical protein
MMVGAGPWPALRIRNQAVKTGSIRVGAWAACVACLILGASIAEAAGESKKPKVPVTRSPAVTAYSSTKSPVAAEPQTTGSVGSPADQDANCTKSRKRLWVEGEGWVVRRVTTCF